MVIWPRIGVTRRLIAVEAERLMGYPANHTKAILTLGLSPKEAERRRLSLLGSAWHLSVAKNGVDVTLWIEP